MYSDNTVYIVDGLRTAIASPFKGFKNFSVERMSAALLAELFARHRLKKERLSEVILGNTVSAGTGQNFARQALALADFPMTIPAYTVNNVCGSGLQAVLIAAQALGIGQARSMVAGGAESASLAPLMIIRAKGKDPVESLIYDGLLCHLTKRHMGELCESLAAENNISRQEQDRYAWESFQKALRAKEQGKFSKEIVPVVVSPARVVSEDDRLIKKTSLEKLAQLTPVFRKNGTITAGNASAPCDGACAFLMGSRAFVEDERLFPQARLLGYAHVAVDPQSTFTAAGKAIEKCLGRCRLGVKDIDLFEITESFAAQAIWTCRALGLPPEKTNIWGGDVALGHPLGMAGARALVTLMHALSDQKKKRGLTAVVFGGGGSIAVIIENLLVP